LFSSFVDFSSSAVTTIMAANLIGGKRKVRLTKFDKVNFYYL
jgi:hypothetical protein